MYSLKIKIKSLQTIVNIQNILFKIKHFLKIKNLKISGNIKNKKKSNIYTVLRSPHVYKKSREHFNYNFYTYNLYIYNSNLFTIINLIIIIKKLLSNNSEIKYKIIKN